MPVPAAESGSHKIESHVLWMFEAMPNVLPNIALGALACGNGVCPPLPWESPRLRRVNSMRALVDRNVLSITVLNQVQSELTDAERRRRDALNQFAMAKQRLASMEAEALRVQTDLKNDLEVEIETIERQVIGQ